jgi:hypothetical protein
LSGKKKPLHEMTNGEIVAGRIVFAVVGGIIIAPWIYALATWERSVALLVPVAAIVFVVWMVGTFYVRSHRELRRRRRG